MAICTVSRVGIDLERARGRRRVTAPALSVAGRVPSSTVATFPEAPLRSRTVGFPESGSDLGFSPPGLPARAEAEALNRMHPCTRGLPGGSSTHGGSALPGSVSGRHLNMDRQVPRAPSPEAGVTGRRAASSAALGGISSLLRSYGLMRQTTPLPLHRPWPLTSGLCRLLSAPAAVWPFPTLVHAPFPACLDPYSGCPWSARSRFFPQGIGLPRFLSGSALGEIRRATSRRLAFSELQSFLYVQARRFARHPGRSHRAVSPRRAAVAFPSEHLAIRYLLAPRICLPSESGN